MDLRQYSTALYDAEHTAELAKQQLDPSLTAAAIKEDELKSHVI